MISFSCFFTHENTWHWICLTYQKIISHQIAIQILNIWHSSLLAKQINILQSICCLRLETSSQILSVTFYLVKQNDQECTQLDFMAVTFIYACKFELRKYLSQVQKTMLNITPVILIYACNFQNLNFYSSSVVSSSWGCNFSGFYFPPLLHL